MSHSKPDPNIPDSTTTSGDIDWSQLELVLDVPITDFDSLEAVQFLASEQAFSRLKSLCRKFVRDPVDHEQIAMDLWIRSIQRREDVSYTAVRNYCYDVLRHRKVQQVAETEKLFVEASIDRAREDSFTKADLVQAFASDHLNEIIERAGLTWQERMLMYRVFWQGMPITEIARLCRDTPILLREELKKIIEKLKTTVAKYSYLRDEE